MKKEKNKKVNKKNKKEKQVAQPLVLGEKIRDIKINERQHFLMFSFMLIFFNMLLVASVGFVLVYLNTWYNWVICFAILLSSFGISFKTYLNIKNFHKCEIYNNALVLNSIWNNISVALKDIYEITVKETRLDRLFKLNTKSLEIKILNHRRKKFTIHFIEEDVNDLRFEILKIMEKDSKKQTKKTSK